MAIVGVDIIFVQLSDEQLTEHHESIQKSVEDAMSRLPIGKYVVEVNVF